MSDITDWEPEISLSSPSIEYSVSEYRQQIRALESKIATLESLHAKALKQAQDSHTTTFNCFKTDVLVTLKALELVAIASQRNGKISLNHHVRDMRLQHLQSIITNAISDFCDRRLSVYTDDF